jgi:hypothetical protein
MKSSKFFKGFTLSAIVIALCAFQSTAEIRSITLGNATGADLPLNFLSTTTGVSNDLNNPNLFSVYFAESAIGSFGFLLDGSEWSKALMKRFEDAHATNSNITIYYDDNFANGFKVMNTLWAPNTLAQVFKVVYVSTAKR